MVHFVPSTGLLKRFCQKRLSRLFPSRAGSVSKRCYTLSVATEEMKSREGREKVCKIDASSETAGGNRKVVWCVTSCCHSVSHRCDGCPSERYTYIGLCNVEAAAQRIGRSDATDRMKTRVVSPFLIPSAWRQIASIMKKLAWSRSGVPSQDSPSWEDDVVAIVAASTGKKTNSNNHGKHSPAPSSGSASGFVSRMFCTNGESRLAKMALNESS